MKKIVKVGITAGDPAGIGPEIISKALKSAEVNIMTEFSLIGDKKIFQRAGGSYLKRYRIFDLKNVPQNRFRFGQVNAACGKASVEYIYKAVELLRQKQFDCLVTCPVSKEAIELAGFKHNSHTELLAHLCRVKDPLMLLVNKYLKFSLITRHVALKEVSRIFKKEIIYKTILSTRNALKDMFKIRNPRLAVLGLNPHASDGGLFGNEEIDIIQPVLKKIKSKIDVDGPLPADSGIYKLMLKKYDCAVAAYHDQALIALKLTDAQSGVNLTYGFPFVRTSPLHGTAFDIAGKNKANPNSLIWAIKLAVQCTLSRRSA